MANYPFTAVYVGEATIKMIGLGPKGYFKVGWNKFDFFLVITAVIDLISTAFAHQLQQVSRLHSRRQACRALPEHDWPD